MCSKCSYDYVTKIRNQAKDYYINKQNYIIQYQNKLAQLQKYVFECNAMSDKHIIITGTN